MKNHPDKETLVDWLFGEEGTDGADAADIEAHLADCPACRARVESWRQARARLDEWELGEEGALHPTWPSRFVASGPATAVRPGPWAWLGRAAAAAALVAAGVWMGRSSSSPPGAGAEALDIGQLKAEIVAELQVAIDEARIDPATHARLAAALDQQAGELRAIRKDLEIVALNAERRIEGAEQGLVRLAALQGRGAPRPAVRQP